MKALVLKDYMRLSYEDAPAPELGASDVMIKVEACGICGSDVHGMDGSTGRRRPPIIMGHEAAGMVSEIGRDVKDWQSGDRVTFDSTIYCGTCDFCRRGQVNLCNNRRVLGVSCADYRQHGAFAEYVVVPQRILYRIPDALPFEQAALLEPFTVAFHAVGRSPVTLNETAVVIGCGMIGLAIIQAARLSGFGRIIAVDVALERLAQAKAMGATDTINSGSPKAIEAVLDLTNGTGADRAFEAVGVATTVDFAIRCVRKGGEITLVGNVAVNVEMPLQAIVTRELKLHGTCAASGEYPACLEMMARGAIDAKPMLSLVAPLSEGAACFDRLYRKEPGLLKIVLKP